MSSYAPGSGQYFVQFYGREGDKSDEPIVQARGDSESGDAEGKVLGRDIQGDDEHQAHEEEEVVEEREVVPISSLGRTRRGGGLLSVQRDQ